MALKQRKGGNEKTRKGKITGVVHTHKSKKGKNNALYVVTLTLGAFFTAILSAWVWYALVERRHYTPFSAPAAHNNNDEYHQDRLWGTYRPQLYFGVRTKTPQSLLFGMMWSSLRRNQQTVDVRYTCEQSDNLQKYGWLKHDGRLFGRQEIVDGPVELRTDFMRQPGGDHGGDWTARVYGRPVERFQGLKKTVNIWFVITTEGDEHFKHIVEKNSLKKITGRTDVLGDFTITFRALEGSNVKYESFLASYEQDVYAAKDAVYRKLKNVNRKGFKKAEVVGLPGNVKNKNGKHPNFFVYHAAVEMDFTLEVIFESSSHTDRVDQLSGLVFEETIRKQIDVFDAKFAKLFIVENSIIDDFIEMMQSTLSNMIGGIGYFHGKSLIRTAASGKDHYEYFEAELLTGVPSRSFFPRGFLWDEGFHQIMVQRWDPQITKQVLSHWLDLMNYNGWIPREQILGVEARGKVPAEFVVQHYENANPPVFFLTLQALIQKHGESAETVEFLRRIFPRLKGWFNWFNTTQSGKRMGTYRWHGRDPNIEHELNPKTLTSGLDDYPRASHPSDDERHVDLRCWIAVASGVLADIADLIGVESAKFRETELYLKDNNLLDMLHWSNRYKAYCDYGNHTQDVSLQWQHVGPPNQQQRLLLRKTKSTPRPGFVNQFGYVSLFPFLLKILNHDSPRLETILKDIYNPDKLWTKFGLRSMSRQALMYNERNTEHDKPYWRGPIWMNINYLAYDALRHYSRIRGPYQKLAHDIRVELRPNLLNNVYIQYTQTGYIWEQYNDKTGKGQGCYPFTGWSGLILLITADVYADEKRNRPDS